MAEYIERGTAIAWFMPYAHAGESIDADVVISDIKGMKAADVAPVRYGEWIEQAWRPTCSLCGFSGSLIDAPISPFKYCPNCGAKMDKEEE